MLFNMQLKGKKYYAISSTKCINLMSKAGFTVKEAKKEIKTAIYIFNKGGAGNHIQVVPTKVYNETNR